ncbi:MAG: SAM-dependent methyltransferase [Planctomycetota bacterium]|jgi:SAM-dependent methyltransferase
MSESEVTLCHRRGDCRGCSSTDLELILDLGQQPCANALLESIGDAADELRFPLEVFLCRSCGLVQLLDVVDAEHLFGHYLYLTGMSETMRVHFADYAQFVYSHANLKDSDGLVVDVASNDGSLLKAFQRLGCRVLGVEPARNVASLAEADGIPTVSTFFSEAEAELIREEHGPAAVCCANNVLAHVDDTLGFLTGMRKLVEPAGHVVVEAPQLWHLIQNLEYDTVYHEHLCYLSVTALAGVFERAGLYLESVHDVSVHGGSLRYVARPKAVLQGHSDSVLKRIEAEKRFGLTDRDRLLSFAQDVVKNRDTLTTMVRDLVAEGKKVAAYGAPAKGNTLLNYCGLTSEDIAFTVDRSPLKQGCLLPGTHIPVLNPEELLRQQPDFVIILPWNIADEIVAQQAEYRRRGGRFIVPIPRPRILE